MEWIDGFDLAQLLTDQMLQRTREQASDKRWTHVNDVVVTAVLTMLFIVWPDPIVGGATEAAASLFAR